MIEQIYNPVLWVDCMGALVNAGADITMLGGSLRSADRSGVQIGHGGFRVAAEKGSVNGDGHIVVYMGDDERGEFLYRFVSSGVYAEGGENADLLSDGALYVAKIHPDGTGQWLALTPETTGMASQAEVVIHARMGASAVGATTMDRPEWVAANPNKAEIYVALTNNKNRGVKPNAGGDATPAMGANPRAENNYGQIMRWWPSGAEIRYLSDDLTPAIHNEC